MPRGGGGGGRGGKRSHKGRSRQFTQPEDLKAAADKEERERAWRRQRGIESDEEENEEKTEEGATASAAKKDSESSSEEESSDDEGAKAKGVSHLIEIENPNRAVKATKKVTEIGDAPVTSNLSRREREALEKQEAKRRYDKMHAEGKTDEAQADLARLAIIRKKREEQARQKEEERKAKEEAQQLAAKNKGKS